MPFLGESSVILNTIATPPVILYYPPMDTNSLSQLLAPLASASLDLSLDDYPVILVSNSSCSARIALHGAHLFHWAPTGAQNVIYNSPNSIYREGKAIRGGVPICWPWFNAHPTDHTLPSHGIARNRFWNLTDASESEHSTTLTFSLTSSEETMAIWPHEFLATVTITLGEQATISLTSTNTGASEIIVGGALHTYLSVNHVSEATISGLEDTAYINTVGTESHHTQSGPITFDQEVDRIYTNTSADITLSDSQRSLLVSRSGSSSAVVWNPWIEKAKGLGDLPDEAYQHFVCIEAANAKEDVHPLAPGESHTLSTTISTL